MRATIWKMEGYMYRVVETGTLVTGDGLAEGSVSWGNSEDRPGQGGTRYRERVPIGL